MRFIFLWMIFLTSSIFAATPEWKIVPDKSRLTFTATQNNAPVIGEFKSFDGEIHFDPNELKTSRVRIIINIASIKTSYGEVATTLESPEWFNSKKFPKAIFESRSFRHINKNSYEAEGTLKILDKTVPITLTFVLDQFTDKKAHVTGKAQLKRSAFGIGTGNWASTDEIKDEVEIDFVVDADAKNPEGK